MRKSPKAEKFIKNMEARRNRPISEEEREDRTVRGYLCAVLVILLLTFSAVPVMAAGDPLASINKLSDFIFAAIKAIGLILLGFGVVQIGLSLKSHDPGQRAQGIMAFFGGVVIAFAKDILDMIVT